MFDVMGFGVHRVKLRTFLKMFLCVVAAVGCINKRISKKALWTTKTSLHNVWKHKSYMNSSKRRSKS